MSQIHDISQPWPFRQICDAGSSLPNLHMEETCTSGITDNFDFYQTYLHYLPKQVIIPTNQPIKRITLTFGTDNELIVSKILEALSDKVTSSIKISKLAGEIYDGLSLGNRGPVNRVAYLDKMVGLEQTSLDLRDVLETSGCYIENRWMPYLYETILPDYSLLLTLPRSLEEFHDSVNWSMW